MPQPRRTRDIIREFAASDESVLILPFDGTKENVSDHWHAFLTDDRWNFIKKGIVLTITRNMSSGRLKNWLLRKIGMNVGRRVFIASAVELDIQFPELITIEDGAILGMHSHIATHEVTHSHIRLGKVRIGRNALIGGQATVRSGVSIGENSVVALRSFVTEDVPPNTLVTGMPERHVKPLHGAV
jgi:acetyltransferase-like isoleucine patch superfamily enzyme